VIEVWKDVLERDVISLDDNFFELGGDSVMAMSMCFRLGEMLGIEFGPEVMFDAATPEALAEKLDALLTSSRTVALESGSEGGSL
jgi:acyl carrier protein